MSIVPALIAAIGDCKRKGKHFSSGGESTHLYLRRKILEEVGATFDNQQRCFILPNGKRISEEMALLTDCNLYELAED